MAKMPCLHTDETETQDVLRITYSNLISKNKK